MKRHGFVLLEALLAVAIFALGVLTLGRCISQGLVAERLRMEDTRARRILQNRFEEIEAGAVKLDEKREQLEGANKGLTLIQSRVPLHKRDEHDRELSDLFVVTLTVEWTSDAAKQSRSLVFYAPKP